MAELQYIGARYVPKFYDNGGSTEWTANTIYEALTIVTRNGNSYTSKIPVPSNIGYPENNPQYWAATGLFNMQVELYRQEVEGISETIKEVDKTYLNVSSMKSDTELEVGKICKTIGYYAENDGGGGLYLVVDTTPSTHYETLENGLYAKLIFGENINVKQFGAKGDGIKNDTDAIQEAINYAESIKGKLYIPDGTYIIDGITIDDFIDVECVGVLTASSDCTNVVTVNVPYFYQSGTFSTWHKISRMQFRIDGNDYAKVGINALQANHCIIGYGTVIYGITDYGIKMGQPNPEFLIDGVFIEGAGNTCVGILTADDSEIRNVIIKDAHIAIDSSYSCFINNVHAWVTRNPEGSIFIKHNGGTLFVSDCYSDTYQYTFYKSDTAGTMLCKSFRVFVNQTYLSRDNAYVFYAGDANSYRYSVIEGLYVANINFANRNDLIIGYTNCRFDNMTIPNTINLIASPTFTGQTNGSNTIKFNPITKRIIIDIACNGDFTNGAVATTLNNLFGSEKFLPLLYNETQANFYNAATCGQLYLATNGNMVIKLPSSMTGCKAICGHFELETPFN